MTLRRQAEAIWRAGVAAVDSATLVRNSIRCRGGTLEICGSTFLARSLKRIVVIGAGKAGAGMSAGAELALSELGNATEILGWVNVPADCVRPMSRIHLHPARPPSVNEPTSAGIFGCDQILQLVENLSADDLCLVLISGGGSALLPAPVEGILPADKLAVTRRLMRSGVTIHELNAVRKRLSRIKGGGLLRSARAGQMIALIISDVPGDPLEVIASGPTFCDSGTARDALDVLEKYVGRAAVDDPIPEAVWKVLDKQACDTLHRPVPTISCENYIIGNNQTALDAAAFCATELGFAARKLGSDRQGIARDVGRGLAELCLDAQSQTGGPGLCFLGGGEPVVHLAQTDKPRKGGRTQEVALAAGCHWGAEDIQRLLVLSGGTDGEDGPTDAAGAFYDAEVQRAALDRGLKPEEFLAINDSYTFFDQVGGLLKTGPTHTNVMDLQIALIEGITE